MRRFDGKVALITGAGSGIGRATAVRLANEGASVACVDVNEDGLKETIGLVDGPSKAFVCDVTDEDQVKSTVAQVAEHFGQVDVLCNIAGILRADHTHELSTENFQRIVDVNLKGTFLFCREAIPELLKTKGNIVNMSSTAALGSHPWMVAYAASKGGVLSLTNALFSEYVKQGLRANAVCAGGVATPLHGQFRLPKGADPTLLQGAIPPVPYAQPDDIAAVVAFLGSDDAKFINGTMLRVDGGALS